MFLTDLAEILLSSSLFHKAFIKPVQQAALASLGTFASDLELVGLTVADIHCTGAGLAPPRTVTFNPQNCLPREALVTSHLHVRAALRQAGSHREPRRQRQWCTSDASLPRVSGRSPGDKAEMPPECTGGRRSGSQGRMASTRPALCSGSRDPVPSCERGRLSVSSKSYGKSELVRPYTP